MNTEFPHAFVVNIMSDDHPGIVAAVGGAVEQLGGNIDSASQTVLSGYFTLIMIVSLPSDISPDELAARIRKGDANSCMQVLARPFVPMATACGDCDTFVVTAFGPDMRGVLLRFSQYLSGKDINIVDLYGARRGKDFTLISQVQVPRHWDIGMLQADMEEVGRELGFAVRLQHENIFVATNQLRMLSNA